MKGLGFRVGEGLRFRVGAGLGFRVGEGLGGWRSFNPEPQTLKLRA